MAGQILVRLPAGTAATVHRRAEAARLTAAAWVRSQLVDRLGTEPEDAVPVQARRAPRPPAPAHVLEIAKLREAVAKLTGVLVQAAIRSREGEWLDLHAEIEATLPSVRAAVLDIDALKRAMLIDERSR